MRGILALPVELLLLITTFITTFKSLSALTRAHPYLVTILTPSLYNLALADIRSFLPFYRRPRQLHTLSHLPSLPITRIHGSGYASIVGWALLHGPRTLLQRLLAPGGVSPNAVFVHWWGELRHVSLLSVAVMHVRIDAAETLLRAGARINALDGMGWTPLRWARTGTLQVGWSRIVVPNGARIPRKWDREETEMGKLLLRYGAVERIE